MDAHSMWLLTLESYKQVLPYYLKEFNLKWSNTFELFMQCYCHVGSRRTVLMVILFSYCTLSDTTKIKFSVCGSCSFQLPKECFLCYFTIFSLNIACPNWPTSVHRNGCNTTFVVFLSKALITFICFLFLSKVLITFIYLDRV